MANPDRDRVDQESSIGQSSESAPSSGDQSQSGSDRTRARVKPPGQPRSASPTIPVARRSAPPEVVDGRSFVFKGRPEEVAEPAAEDESAPAPANPWATKVRPSRKAIPRIQADLSGKLQVQGQHPGDRYVRVVRRHSDDFEFAGPGHLVATEEAMESSGAFGRTITRAKRRLIGAPLT